MVWFHKKPKYDYANANETLRIERNFGNGRGAGLTDAQINANTTDTDCRCFLKTSKLSYSQLEF
jgi:hypothetical protein